MLFEQLYKQKAPAVMHRYKALLLSLLFTQANTWLCRQEFRADEHRRINEYPCRGRC